MNTSHSTRACAAIMVGVALLTACGGGDVASPATSAPIPNTAPVTVLTTTSTVAPSTSTTAAPTVPSTAAPETTTVDDQTEAVIEAAELAWHTFNEAVLDPTSDEKLHALNTVFEGEVLERATAIIESYRAERLEEVTSDVAPWDVAVIADSIEFDDSNSVAHVRICRLGSNVLLQLGGNPDGSDRVVDDTINSHLEQTSLRLDAGTWKVFEDVDIESFPGAIECVV